MVTTAIKQLRLVLQSDGSWQGEILTEATPDTETDRKIFGVKERSLSIEASADVVGDFLSALEVTSAGDWPEDVLELPAPRKKTKEPEAAEEDLAKPPKPSR